EVGDHVELVHDLGRALDEVDVGDVGAHAGDEIDPLADAERADLAHPGEVEDEDLGLDRRRELLAVERFVDRAREAEASDRPVGELVQAQLGVGRGDRGGVHHASAPSKECTDLACVLNSRKLRSRSNTPVTSVLRPRVTSNTSAPVAARHVAMPSPAPPPDRSIAPARPRARPSNTWRRSRRPNGSVTCRARRTPSEARRSVAASCWARATRALRSWAWRGRPWAST